MKYLLLTCLLLASCTEKLAIRRMESRIATCKLNDFSGFPSVITGPITVELSKALLIAVFNKDRSEMIEIGFPKEKCTIE
jgi:hypothetical protein